jgi:flagellar hook-associated protein 3 FlgL
MRITNQMLTNSASQHISDSLEALQKIQNRVALGKQFENASEDPQAASFSLSLKSALNSIQSYQATASKVSDWMTASDFAFQNTSEVAVKAINLVTSGLNGTVSAADRAGSFYQDMDGLVSQAFDLANTTQTGQYIFSGYKIDKAAFSITFDPALSDPITGQYLVKYEGDSGAMQLNINTGQAVQKNVPGDLAFQDFLKGLVQAREAFKANDTGALRQALSGLQSGLDKITQAQAGNGTRMRQVQATSDYLEKSGLETNSMLSKNEDLDLAQGISLLRSQETNYNAVLEVTSRAISAMNLFDYLK